jgi:hypothetical protein
MAEQVISRAVVLGGSLAGLLPANVRIGPCTRPLIEKHVRERMAKVRNVRFLEQYDVVGLEATHGAGRPTSGGEDGYSRAGCPGTTGLPATGRSRPHGAVCARDGPRPGIGGDGPARHDLHIPLGCNAARTVSKSLSSAQGTRALVARAFCQCWSVACRLRRYECGDPHCATAEAAAAVRQHVRVP